MKKTTLSVVVVLLLLFGVALSANAALFAAPGYTPNTGLGTWDETYQGYSHDDEYWSGYFIGLFGGNDSQADLEYYAEEYLVSVFGSGLDETMYDKVDPVPGTGENNILSTTATEFKDGNEPIAGTWSAVIPYALGFYSVKGGNEWALYYVDPYQTSGNWATIHLTTGNSRPEISHLSGLATVPVPEPSAMLLIGLGLVGVAGLGRNKLIKK